MNDFQRVAIGNVELTFGFLKINGLDARLTALEHQVATALLTAPEGTVVTRTAMTEAVYPNTDTPPASNVLEVIVSRLRKKLAAAGADVSIKTARGRGWRLAVEEPQA